jgi:hypothetical protein
VRKRKRWLRWQKDLRKLLRTLKDEGSYELVAMAILTCKQSEVRRSVTATARQKGVGPISLKRSR